MLSGSALTLTRIYNSRYSTFGSVHRSYGMARLRGMEILTTGNKAIGAMTSTISAVKRRLKPADGRSWLQFSDIKGLKIPFTNLPSSNHPAIYSRTSLSFQAPNSNPINHQNASLRYWGNRVLLAKQLYKSSLVLDTK